MNETPPPQDLDFEDSGDLDALEERLRNLRPSVGPANRDDLMFRCGQAAAKAELSRLSRQAKRWRLGCLATAAVCVAMVSITGLGRDSEDDRGPKIGTTANQFVRLTDCHLHGEKRLRIPFFIL